MRTEQLHYFREAARHGSINAAAEKLHMSQQGLNASLKMLEKDLGYELFTTSRYGITLTPQGEIVLAYADKMLAGFHSMQNALSSSIRMFSWSMLRKITETGKNGSIIAPMVDITGTPTTT